MFLSGKAHTIGKRIVTYLVLFSISGSVLFADPAMQLLPYQQTKDDITLGVRCLSTQEIQHIFMERAAILQNRKHPIIPLHLSIENKSDKNVRLKKSDIALNLVDSSIVLKRLYGSPAGKIVSKSYTGFFASIGFGCAALTCISLGLCAATGPIGLLLGAPLFYVGMALGATSVGCFVLMPFYGAFSGVSSHIQNANIVQEVSELTFSDDIEIEAQGKKEFLIFAQGKKFKLPFTVTLHLSPEIDAKTTSFTVS